MPKHIVRLVVLLAAAGVLALAVKIYLVPHSFWTYGHFRAKSVTEIASDAPVYQGARSCASCHSPEFTAWSASQHRVNCEDCHGAAGRHPQVGTLVPPANADTHQRLMDARYGLVTGKMRVPTDTVQLCTQCHAAIAGRPATQPQIAVRQHAGTQQCIACHSPHAPKIVFPPIPKAALVGSAVTGKVAAAPCAGCHGANGKSLTPEFPNLAGQQRAYLVGALEAYRTGARKAPMMNEMAASLSATDIANVAAYFSGLGRQTPTAVRLVSDAGSDKASAAACTTCHGEGGISGNRVVPNLAGQSETYLTAALEAYRIGTRQDALMSRIAHGLSAADIKQLAAYYAGLTCGGAKTSPACKAAP
ncbi:MAG: c-type cytochrome [Alphaproteobacteria bacterium]|nr:c-type cytochrome [Alphaproteobacteria bacterium]